METKGCSSQKGVVSEYSVTVDGYPVTSAERDGSDLVITTWTNVGYSGFYAGPGTHIVDIVALGEPLLARLPARQEPEWGPGHCSRLMPEGYLETHIRGHNMIADSSLAVYYDKLCVVTRGDLFDFNRWIEIWNINTGEYDHLIDYDAYRHPSDLSRRLSDLRVKIDSDRLIAVGREYSKLGNTEKAVPFLQEALSLNITSLRNRFIVAEIFLDNQQYDLAVEAYREVLDLSPEHTQDISSNSYTQLGVVLFHLGRTNDAIRAYRKALEKNERDFTARTNLGWCYFLKEMPDEAISAYRFVLARQFNSSAQFNLGLAYLLKGDIDAARATYAAGVARVGVTQGEKTGAVDNLNYLISRNIRTAEAKEILTTFWNR